MGRWFTLAAIVPERKVGPRFRVIEENLNGGDDTNYSWSIIPDDKDSKTETLRTISKHWQGIVIILVRKYWRVVHH